MSSSAALWRCAEGRDRWFALSTCRAGRGSFFSMLNGFNQDGETHPSSCYTGSLTSRRADPSLTREGGRYMVSLQDQEKLQSEIADVVAQSRFEQRNVGLQSTTPAFLPPLL